MMYFHFARRFSAIRACCFSTCGKRACTSGRAARGSFPLRTRRRTSLHPAAFQDTMRELREGGFLGGVRREVACRAARTGHQPQAAAEIKAPDQCRRSSRSGLRGRGHARGESAAVFALLFRQLPGGVLRKKYRLIADGTRLADAHGFQAVWLPERHFHPVGGFSPNPSVLAAALARETKHIKLHGGSVVVPLHHPVRIAEEWSIVDNLSHGRAGISFASGWHPNDFVFAPGNFEKRRELYYDGIETVRRLWRGEPAQFRAARATSVEVHIHPLPKQAELPTWITCIHRDAFVKAGELGANVLAPHGEPHPRGDRGENRRVPRSAGEGGLRARARHASGAHVPRGKRDAGRGSRRASRFTITSIPSSITGKRKAQSQGRQIEVAQRTWMKFWRARMPTTSRTRRSSARWNAARPWRTS